MMQRIDGHLRAGGQGVPRRDDQGHTGRQQDGETTGTLHASSSAARPQPSTHLRLRSRPLRGGCNPQATVLVHRLRGSVAQQDRAAVS